MNNDFMPYSLTIWGVTLTFTLDGTTWLVGLIMGIVGMYLTYLNLKEKRLYRLEVKRTNDLRERELDATTANGET